MIRLRRLPVIACQRSSEIRLGGLVMSRLVATSCLSAGWLGCQRDHPFAGEGLREAVGVALRQHEVGVVQGRSTVAVARVLGMMLSNPVTPW